MRVLTDPHTSIIIIKHFIMRRIAYMLFAMLFVLTSCEEPANPEKKNELKLSITSLQFSGKSGSEVISITSTKAWSITNNTGIDWCTPERTSGEVSMPLSISVKANEGDARSAEITFSSQDCPDVQLIVNQAAAEEDASEIINGVYTTPSKLDADKECTIWFKPDATSPLYQYTGDLYAHIGVGNWFCVQADWNENIDKCKFTKVEDNLWSLQIKPSIRSWFDSGETPVTAIALVIRNSDGTMQTSPDIFIDVEDKKYSLDPGETVEEPLPDGVEYGINYNSDGSVTLVFYDYDKNGKSHDYAYLKGDFNDWSLSNDYLMKRDSEEGCWWFTLSNIDPNKEYRFQYYLGYKDAISGREYADPYSEIVYESSDRYISSSTYPDLPEYPSSTRGAISAFQVNQPEYNWQIADYEVEDENDLIIYELHFRDFSTTGDINGAMEKLDYLEDLGINAIELMPIQEFSGADSWGYNPIAYFALEKSYGTREMYKRFIDECHKRDIAVIVDVVYNHAHQDHAMAGLYFDWTNYVPTSNNPWFNTTAPHPFSVFHDWNHDNQMTTEHIKQSLKYLIEEYNIDGFRFDLTKGFTNTKSNESTASNYDADRVAILQNYISYIKSVDDNAVIILEHFADSENEALSSCGAKLWRNMNWAYRSALLGSSTDFSPLYTGSKDEFGSLVGYMESHDEERTCYGAIQSNSGVKWGICGTITGWGEKSDITLKSDGALFVAKNVTFGSSDMFKIRGNSDWDDAYNYGASTKGYKLPLNSEYPLVLGSSSQDMAPPAAGTYDIYFSPDVKKIWVMTPGKRPKDPETDNEDGLTVAMRRAGLNAAFFLTIPGPKMIWQFGELGYDISIEENGRTGRKPVKWDYYEVPERKALYDTYSNLLEFRRDNPRFFDSDAKFSWNATASNWPARYIFCEVEGKRFAVVGNFGSVTEEISITLPTNNTWYNYFDRDEKYSGGNQTITLKEGEFRLLTNF